jgi:flagellar hook protein FlgE
MDISAIALQGLQQADAQLNKAAAGIASANTLSDQSSPDAVDLSSQLVALIQAQSQFDVSLKVLTTAEQVQKQTLDVKI